LTKRREKGYLTLKAEKGIPSASPCAPCGAGLRPAMTKEGYA